MSMGQRFEAWAESRTFQWLCKFFRILYKIMKIVKIVILAEVCILLIMSLWVYLFESVPPSPTPEEVISDLGIDMSSGTVGTSINKHDPFHGDGITFMSVSFGESGVENALTENEKWTPLPLSAELSVLVYGDPSQGREPSIFAENLGEALLPEIKNGYYCFIDRYNISNERPEDKNILERYSQNFTLVIYDTDTNTLYYAELDT